MTELVRCNWAGTDPRMIAYHDEEWGVPVHDDRLFFEFLTLEGAQAGLSWSTILYKRDAYREAFAGFEPERVARFDRRRVERLLTNPGIVRNRQHCFQRARISRPAARARQLRSLRMELRRWRAKGESLEADRLSPAAHQGIRCAIEGARPARLPLRRLDDLLCVHAGDGAGG